jgi:hypothetical protein
MRIHQALRKKSSDQKESDPTFNFLASRPFAVQPTHEEETRSALAFGNAKGERSSASLSHSTMKSESAMPEFAILNPEGGQTLPLQPKLTLGTPGDKYEQEADSVAQQADFSSVRVHTGPQSIQASDSLTIRRWPTGSTKHLKDRAAERGITESQIDAAVNSGQRFNDGYGGTAYWDSSTGVTVCEESNGTKTTCYIQARPKSRWTPK